MKIGFAFCGSFCNHPELLKLYEDIAREHEIVPILSENAAKYSTRFGTAEDFVTRVEALAGRKAVRNIVEAEPLGPQGAMEVLVIAPCTGNTLAKLAHGITDGAVTMAAKFIGWSDVTIRYALQEERAPFGIAAQNPKTGTWAYNISPGLLIKYKNGELQAYKLKDLSQMLADHAERIIETRVGTVSQAIGKILGGCTT